MLVSVDSYWIRQTEGSALPLCANAPTRPSAIWKAGGPVTILQRAQLLWGSPSGEARCGLVWEGNNKWFAWGERAAEGSAHEQAAGTRACNEDTVFTEAGAPQGHEELKQTTGSSSRDK